MISPILTPEIIEAAARAIYCLHSTVDNWEWLSDAAKFPYREQARAALTAALPAIGETFAKVADEHDLGERNGIVLMLFTRDELRSRIAAAQRALAPLAPPAP